MAKQNAAQQSGLRVVELRVANVKRISAVHISPDRNVVEIRGDNEAGKSSVIDSIAMALGGKDLCPPEPIKRGRDRAEVEVDLGPYKVRRVFTPKDSYLKIVNADGVEQRSPQAILDDLIGALAFDPLAFAKMKPVEQRETLINLCGLKDDLDKFNARLRKRLDEQKEAKRNAAAAKALVDAQPIPEDTPDEEIPLDALLDSLRAAEQENARWAGMTDRAIRAKDAAKQSHAAAESQIGLANRCDERIRELEEMIAKVREEKSKAIREAQRLNDEAANRLSEAEGLVAEVEDATLHVDPTVAVRAEIEKTQKLNASVRAKKSRQQSMDGMKEWERREQVAADEVANVRQLIRDLLTSAKYPIDGLSFDESGVTYNGIPFEQESTSVQLKVSVAMGMALNSGLRVIFIKEGEKLDDRNREALYEMVRGNDYQVWIERVGTPAEGDAPCVLIEDGRVAE